MKNKRGVWALIMVVTLAGCSWLFGSENAKSTAPANGKPGQTEQAPGQEKKPSDTIPDINSVPAKPSTADINSAPEGVNAPAQHPDYADNIEAPSPEPAPRPVVAPPTPTTPAPAAPASTTSAPTTTPPTSTPQVTAPQASAPQAPAPEPPVQSTPQQETTATTQAASTAPQTQLAAEPPTAAPASGAAAAQDVPDHYIPSVTGDFSPQPKPFSPNGAPTDLAGPGAVPLRTGLQALPGEQGYLAGQYPLYAARSTAQAVYVSPYGSAVNATRLQLAGSVFFARGSANLAPASVASLQEVAAAQRQTGRPLQILGSASANRAGSNLGSNAALSLARAHAVANRLVALGVPANLVEIVGVGDTRARGLDIPTDRRVDIYLAY